MHGKFIYVTYYMWDCLRQSQKMDVLTPTGYPQAPKLKSAISPGGPCSSRLSGRIMSDEYFCKQRTLQILQVMEITIFSTQKLNFKVYLRIFLTSETSVETCKWAHSHTQSKENLIACYFDHENCFCNKNLCKKVPVNANKTVLENNNFLVVQKWAILCR